MDPSRRKAAEPGCSDRPAARKPRAGEFHREQSECRHWQPARPSAHVARRDRPETFLRFADPDSGRPERPGIRSSAAREPPPTSAIHCCWRCCWRGEASASPPVDPTSRAAKLREHAPLQCSAEASAGIPITAMRAAPPLPDRRPHADGVGVPAPCGSPRSPPSAYRQLLLRQTTVRRRAASPAASGLFRTSSYKISERYAHFLGGPKQTIL